MKDSKIDELVRSSIFPDNSGAAYALAMYHNLRQPNSDSLIDAKTGRKYTNNNFWEYLIDFCNVKLKDVDEAIELLQKLSV